MKENEMLTKKDLCTDRMCELATDNSPVTKTDWRGLEADQLHCLINGIPGGIGIFNVYSDNRYEEVYLNDGYYAMLDDARENRICYSGLSALNAVHPEDRNGLTAVLEKGRTEDKIECEMRVITGVGEYKWVCIRANIACRLNDYYTVYASYSDIDELKKTHLRLKEAKEQEEKLQKSLSDIINTVPCGICLFSWDGQSLYPVMVNDRLSRMLGEDAFEYLNNTRDLRYGHVHPEDLESIRSAAYEALHANHVIDHTYRTLSLSENKYIWIRLRGEVKEQPDGTYFVYASYYDVTQEHLAEQKLRDSEQDLEFATERTGLWYWKYDYKNDIAYLDRRNQKEFGLSAVEEGYLKKWISKGFVHPDYIDTYCDAYRRMAEGEKQTTFEIQIYLKDNILHWARCFFANRYDDDGNASITVCTAMLIDTEKELQAKYEVERNKRSVGEDNLVAYAHVNLSTGKTIEYIYSDGSEVRYDDKVLFNDDLKNITTLVIDESVRKRFSELNDTSYLLKQYEEGKDEFSLDYRRRTPEGSIIWVRNVLHMLRDPQSSDILLFEYRYDIDEEKNSELTYLSLANDNYDYVMRVNAKNNHFVVMANNGINDRLFTCTGKNYDEAAEEFVEKCIVEEDKELTLRNIKLDGISKNLQNSDRFRFPCRGIHPDGIVRYKRITQYYLDMEREIIVITCEDVTEIVRAEIEKNEMLSSALESANQASKAKTAFLSRMSHELRTPMNAIIGLSALSAGEIDKPAVMADAISKIGMSGRYLLSLINDILEMSRIESGRMSLLEAPFEFEQFISSVNAIIYEQAERKGIDYDAVVNSYLDPVYVGDATKLQQILINVLGNAVKFTPRGGKITLAMEQIRRTDKTARLRFVVSDTGIGIDNQFIPNLFEPFSQESDNLTSTSAGTGLGLAIAKNITELMDGRIFVQSIKNVGSTFTIEVQLGISEESRRRMEIVNALNLSQIKALVVDDDVIVCQTTEKILTSMGIKAEWAESGIKAIQIVKSRHFEKNDFDTVFIDWKMPVMDGIETTRQIRRIVGQDITIIIMTAYDWKTIEIEAREAGVDMFMEKPLFPFAVKDAFERILAVKKEKNGETPQTVYDLSGMKILLAEDHPLNVEVAKRLLERVGVEVTVTNNGLEALEAFTVAEDFYYDAILMDIRMPIMDGLSTTKNIRNLKKAGSKTIPIIAMTANAFDEDAELSLSSGMNAHLAKPIEPQKLYETLFHLIKN